MSRVASKDPEVLEVLWQMTLLLIAKCEGSAERQEECLGCLRVIIDRRRTDLGIDHEDYTAAMSLLEVLYNIMLRQANNSDQAMLDALQPLPTIMDKPKKDSIFPDGTGFYTMENPAPKMVAIGPRTFQAEELTTDRLLTLVFSAIDIDDSGSCTNAEIFTSKFGKVLEDGLWTGYSSSAFSEWTAFDANDDGVAELDEWLAFFREIKLEMECDNAAFKAFIISVVDKAWPVPEAREHVRTVRMIKYLFDDIVPEGQFSTSKSVLADSALGRVLNEPLKGADLDALPSEALQRVHPTSRLFGEWMVRERKCDVTSVPDDLAIKCASCQRNLQVGGENGWWHDKGNTRDQCDTHYRRMVKVDEKGMAGAAPTKNYVSVDTMDQIGLILGNQLGKYAKGSAELPDWLTLFADIQKDMAFDDSYFEGFVRELMVRQNSEMLPIYLAQLPPEPPPEPVPPNPEVLAWLEELLEEVEEIVTDELLAAALKPPTEEDTEEAVDIKETADKLMEEGRFSEAAHAYGMAVTAFPESTALHKLKALAERKAVAKEKDQKETAEKEAIAEAQKKERDEIKAKAAEENAQIAAEVAATMPEAAGEPTTPEKGAGGSLFRKVQQLGSASKDGSPPSKHQHSEEPGLASTAILAVEEPTTPEAASPSKGLSMISLLSAKKAAAKAKQKRKAAEEAERKALSRRQYQEISKLYQVVGDEEAMTLCQRSYDLALRLFGDDHPRTATGANNLGMLHLQLAGSGNFDEREVAYETAKPLLEKALMLRTNLNGESDPDTASTMHSLGWLMYESAMLHGSTDDDEYENAADLLKNSAQVRCHLMEIEDWPPTAEDLLGTKITTLQERCETEGVAAVTIQKATDSDDPQSRLIWELLEKLAPMDPTSGEHSTEQATRRMNIKRKLEGVPKSSQELMMDTVFSISCLGAVYHSQSKYTQARPILEVSLQFRMQILGMHHIDTAETQNSLGTLLSKTARGNPEEDGDGPKSARSFSLRKPSKKAIIAQETEAERLLNASLVVRKRHLGEKHVDISNTIFELIDIAVRQDRKWEAIPLLEVCLDIRSECLGENHPYTEETLVLLCKLREEVAMRDATQWALCAPLYERILALRDLQGGEDRIETMEVLDALAGCLKECGREAEAIQYWQRALDMTERMFPSDPKHPHPRTASLLNNLAVAHRQAGRDDKAMELWQKDLAICEASVGKHHPDTAVTLNNLAGIHKKRGMRKDRNETPEEYATRMTELHAAKKMYERALSIRSKVLGSEDPRLALTMHSLAAVYKEMRDLKAALPLLQDALEIQRASLGYEHPETVATQKHLAQLYNRLKPKTVRIG